MSELINPTLDLYVYHLREGLGDRDDDVAIRRDTFLSNFPEPWHSILQETARLEAREADPKFVKLLKLAGKKASASLNKSLPLAGEDKLLPVEGYYYPVRLSDTYALLWNGMIAAEEPLPVSSLRQLRQLARKPVNCDRKPESNSAGKVMIFAFALTLNSGFYKLASLLLLDYPEPIAGDLGETWIISGLLPPNGDRLATAEQAYHAFMDREFSHPEEERQHQEQIARDWHTRTEGFLLGIRVWEIWRSPQYGESVSQNIHVLIVLYTEAESAAIADYPISDDFIKLFCYRHKILWMFGETRKLKRELQDGFQTIKNTIQLVKFESSLEILQNTLQDNLEVYADYITNLKNLEINGKTISINLDNYQDLLKYFIQKVKKSGHTELEFWKSFSERVETNYLKQIESDIDSLSPGVDILETQLETIRGIVEIEQAKSDRSFQRFVEVVGAGLATAGAIASASASFVPQIVSDFKALSSGGVPIGNWRLSETGLNLIVTLIFCVGMGGMVSLLVYCRDLRRSKQRSKLRSAQSTTRSTTPLPRKTR